jgi:hypothetical protein
MNAINMPDIYEVSVGTKMTCCMLTLKYFSGPHANADCMIIHGGRGVQRRVAPPSQLLFGLQEYEVRGQRQQGHSKVSDLNTYSHGGIDHFGYGVTTYLSPSLPMTSVDYDRPLPSSCAYHAPYVHRRTRGRCPDRCTSWWRAMRTM